MKRTINYLLVFALIVWLSGCIPSLHPIYTDEDRIRLDEIIGKWTNLDGKETYDFRMHENDSGAYQLMLKELPHTEYGGSDSSSANFEINLVELGGHTFMDFYPDENESLNNLSNHLVFHLLTVHTFARFEVNLDTLKIYRPDPEWLEKLFEENRIRIAHEIVDDGIVLTASTEDLQKFFTKYADDPDAYLSPDILIKMK